MWVQGCSLGCPGCFNPQTHARQAGELILVNDLFEKIADLQDRIEGVSISGGEPLQQLPAITALLARIRSETRLSTLVFTGFSWEEIQHIPAASRFLEQVDVLLAGRYDQNRRVAAGLLGSSNKTVHFLTGRYSPADLETVPEAEVVLSEDGEMLFSGINPLFWDRKTDR